MSKGESEKHVLAAMRDMLTTGELQPGQAVRQGDIADRLGVSRVPVREAMQTLEAVGLLDHTPNRGYVVTRLTFHEIDEIYRLRRMLESDAIRLTMGSSGLPQRLWHMKEAHRRERDAPMDDIVLNTRLNREFHFPLFEKATAAQQRLITQLWDLTDPYRILYYSRVGHLTRSLDEHSQLLELVEEGDTEAVVAFADMHRNHGVTELAKIID